MLPDFYTDQLAPKGEKITDGVEVESVQEGENQLNANFMNYPNVFNISFKGPLGNKIDGFLPAVCTNAQVDYAGGQKFSTFADGQPVHIQMTLNFLEIQTMSLGNYDNKVISDLIPMKSQTGFSTTDSLTQQYGVDGDKFGTEG